jgi:hypothetical protein
MRFPQLETLLKDNRAYSRKSDTARRVAAAITYLDQAFPRSAKSLRNRANTLSVCMLACRVIERGLGTGTAKEFGRFVEDFLAQLSIEVEKGSQGTDKELITYQQAISYGSTGGDSIRTRQDILLKRLATSTPGFSALLGGSQGASDAAQAAIESEGDRLQSVILDRNRRYAAIHGEDLFKMTTESVAGAQRLSRPARDAAAFGQFVDGLYFLVYEGSGSCNRLPKPVPEFAMDVKHLRTLIRHDLDHGTAKEAAAKRQRNAGVFKRYSGKNALGDCGPEDMLAAQTRILAALDKFLGALP